MLEKILAKNNFSDKDRAAISEAFEFAKEAHKNQVRASGESYITHSVAVAEILSDLNLDSATIIAGLLHDTIEDTETTEKDIEKKFGKDVAFLVSGVTKLAKIEYKEHLEDKQRNYARSLRRLFFAMAEDIRVILIKLADRYHNLKTIANLPIEKRQRISLETLEIYGPIAERLGIGHLRGELEDMAFPHAYPKEYAWLIREVRSRYKNRQEYLEVVKPEILEHLQKNRIKILDAHSRAKHYFSLYKKVVKKEHDIDRIYDLVALRIILPSITACYRALGIIHHHYKPIPGLIKDYIALPKLNGYQSIHTSVFCERGGVIEIQLRTPKMHEHAENGVAAHWSYGESGKNKLHTVNLKEARWIAELKKWVENSDDKEFYKSLHANFFSDRIFVMTPKGDIKDLPEDSTPLDFAYAVHTDLGHATKGSKVNGKLVALDYKLKNGEIVEIIKGKNPQPSADWLRIVKSGEAKRKILSWFRQRNVAPSTKYIKELNFVEKKIKAPQSKTISPPKPVAKKIEIFTNGNKNILSSVAKCCSPLPGHEILGYITKHKGVSIHKTECANISRFNPEKVIKISWLRST